MSNERPTHADRPPPRRPTIEQCALTHRCPTCGAAPDVACFPRRNLGRSHDARATLGVHRGYITVDERS